MVLDKPALADLIADRCYDSAWFRQALINKGIEPCIPSSRGYRKSLSTRVLSKRSNAMESGRASLETHTAASRPAGLGHTFGN